MIIGIDDVRERVREGVAAHGWGPVLWMLANELSADADDFEAAGHAERAALLDGAAVHLRGAVSCCGNPSASNPEAGIVAAADEMIETGYAESRGLLSREALRYRLVGVMARHLLAGFPQPRGCSECGYPVSGQSCPVCEEPNE